MRPSKADVNRRGPWWDKNDGTTCHPSPIGPTEAMNILAKRIKRVAFGFRRFLHSGSQHSSTPDDPSNWASTTNRPTRAAPTRHYQEQLNATDAVFFSPKGPAAPPNSVMISIRLPARLPQSEFGAGPLSPRNRGCVANGVERSRTIPGN
jgi:hypothetical protein